MSPWINQNNEDGASTGLRRVKYAKSDEQATSEVFAILTNTYERRKFSLIYI